MKDTIDILKKIALQVRNASTEGENTAERVGRVLVGIIEYLVNQDTSALDQKYIRKDQEDITNFLVSFMAGLKFEKAVESTNFKPGPLGTGVIVKSDPITGRSYIEVDELFVRIKAIFTELEIRKLSYAGGNWIFSAAGGKCAKVEELPDVYRCYIKVSDGETTVENEFRVGDQVRCQEFKIKPGVHQNVASRYYWRLVTAVGEDYIDLSKTDCDASSDAPKAGDAMVQLGHRTDPQRQNAIVISAYGEGSPSFTQHTGINSYSLSGTEKTRISPTKNLFTGEFRFESGEDLKTYVDGKVEANNSEITATKEQIKLMVKKEEFDALGNRVSAAETQITQTANSIELKADKTTVDGMDTRLKSAEVALNADNIWLKVSEKVNTAVNGAVEDKVTVEKVKAGIGVTENGIVVFGKTINLTGCVTFNSLSTQVENTINNAAKNASTAKNDAATALQTANGVSGIASGAATKAEEAYDKAIAAYNKKVGLGDLDTTIIDGGNILTNSIVVKQINAVTGNIGAFEINSKGLTNDVYSPEAYISLGDNAHNYVRINKDKESSLVGLRCNEKYQTALEIYIDDRINTAVHISAQNFAMALHTAGGVKMCQRESEVWNVPGVLWAAKIDYRNGNVFKQWGHGLNAQQFVSKNSKGSFRIHHNLNRIDYFPFVCCESNNNWPVGYVYNLQSTYFDIAIVDTNNGLTDSHFFVMICGRNKF